MIAEEEPEPTTATELAVELETAVIPRVASERADLYLAAMLRGEGPDPASQQPEDSKHPHGRTPYGEDSVQQDTGAPKIGSSLGMRDRARNPKTINHRVDPKPAQISPNFVPTILNADRAKSRSSRV